LLEIVIALLPAASRRLTLAVWFQPTVGGVIWIFVASATVESLQAFGCRGLFNRRWRDEEIVFISVPCVETRG